MADATSQSISVSSGYQIKQLALFSGSGSPRGVRFNCKMKLFLLAAAFVLAIVASVSGEPPERFHQFRRGGFGRLQQFARQTADAPPPQGYDYPKPSGYQYPKPDQPFPLPEEPAPTTTASAPTSTTELPPATTTAVPVDDYEDNATEDPETETVEAEAVAAQLRAARRRQARRRNGVAARLEQEEQDDDQQPQQPIYLVNIPESTLQRLVLLNEAGAAAALPAQLKLAPVTAPLQVAPAQIQQTPQVYITDYGLVYAKK